MKKELYAALAVISVGVYSSAQTISVVGIYDNTIVTYSSDQIKRIVFNPDEEKVEEPSGQVEAIDLGLSVKWASCNVGANSPEDFGCYYAWGETNQKNEYTETNYQYWFDKNGDGDIDNDEVAFTTDIAGTVYDVAHVKWGGSWRMPQYKELRELIENCTWEWIIVNGVSGRKVIGPNGNSIFLPAAGYYIFGNSLENDGTEGFYWCSSPSEEWSRSAYSFGFDSNVCCWKVSPAWRCWGFSVRPVSD